MCVCYVYVCMSVSECVYVCMCVSGVCMYSKAFDTVRHQTLMQKLGAADLPDNWVVHYFTNRGHTTYHQGAMSRLVIINASVIQGSVIGLPSFIIEASDLHLHRPNALMKYADGSYLLIGSINISTATSEFDHISQWATNLDSIHLRPVT